MTQPVILLCHDRVIRNALWTALQVAVTRHPFSIPDLPQTPTGAEPDEYVVSEAMKLACNQERRVVIIGVDRNNTVEKGIDCARFDALIKFLPYPFTLSALLMTKHPSDSDSKLLCKNQKQECTPLSYPSKTPNSYGNIYAGKVIYNICHLISHRDLDEFSTARFNIDLLKNIYIPSRYRRRIDSFLFELTKLSETADRAPNCFETEAMRLSRNSTFKGFPYIRGYR